MGRHDREHQGDGRWDKPIPKEDRRDDGGKHDADKRDTGKHDTGNHDTGNHEEDKE